MRSVTQASSISLLDLINALLRAETATKASSGGPTKASSAGPSKASGAASGAFVPARSVRRGKRMLSDMDLTTLANHVSRVEKLMGALGTKDVLDLFRSPGLVVDFVERPACYTASSRMSFFSSLCALLNPARPFSADVAGAIGRSVAARARSAFLGRNAYWSRRASEKQLKLTKATKERGGALPFEEILAAYKRKRHLLSASDRLLADMYLAAPDEPQGAVRRANYGCCWVVESEPARGAGESTGESAGDPAGEPSKANYLVVPRDGRRPVTIVLNRYKTFVTHGEYRAALPSKLSRIVRQSLEEEPRELLFSGRGPGGGRRCLTPNAFAKRVTGVMKSITGQPLGVNQLRRSYSSYTIAKGLPEADLRRFAEGMNSSVAMMKKVYQRRSLM